MPSMASDSCHITSGCSGLPKFRQFTTAFGVAPEQARLRAASATVAAVPARGSRAHQLGLESVVRARPRVRGGEARRGQPEDGAVATGALDGVEEQLVVVLPVDPRRVGQQGQQVVPAVGGAGRASGVVGQPGVLVGRGGPAAGGRGGRPR